VADSIGAKRGNPAALAFTQRHAEAVADRLMRRRDRREREAAAKE
jgi:membrane protein